jgi:integrase
MATMEKTRTPGIYKRGSRYVVIWRHRGTQHKSFHRTYEEAREAKAQRAAGDKRPVAKVRFESYFDEWIETYAGRTARGFSETTRPEYRRPIETYALPRWRAWKLAEIEPADVRELFGQMRRDEQTTSAIKKLRGALSAMFATAVDDGAVRSNPVAGVRIPAGKAAPEADEKPKALTRSELGMLLSAIDEDWKLFIEFLTHTGVRIGEAIGLRWEHVDLGEQPKIKVREQVYEGERKVLKTAYSSRDIPLSPIMASRLLALRRDAYRGPQSPVFASAAGTELSPGNVYNRALAPAAISAGLFVDITDSKGKPRKRSTVSFHTFRHTCASLLFEAGRNVKQVSEWLGHADPSFTLRTYVHLLDAGVGDAAFFDSAVGPTDQSPPMNTRSNANPQLTEDQKQWSPTTSLVPQILHLRDSRAERGDGRGPREGLPLPRVSERLIRSDSTPAPSAAHRRRACFFPRRASRCPV